MGRWAKVSHTLRDMLFPIKEIGIPIIAIKVVFPGKKINLTIT